MYPSNEFSGEVQRIVWPVVEVGGNPPLFHSRLEETEDVLSHLRSRVEEKKHLICSRQSLLLADSLWRCLQSPLEAASLRDNVQFAMFYV